MFLELVSIFNFIKMLKKRQIRNLLILIMLSFITQLFAQDAEFKKAERIAKRLVKRSKVPGLAISVSKNGEMIWSKGFGYSNLKEQTIVDPKTTIFRVGSVSKSITATSLARLVQQDEIDINASIYKYLPNYPKLSSDFTLKQLGGHLAGLRNYKGNEFLNNKQLTIKEGVDLFKNDALLFEPNTDYSYTSYSFNLLSLAMQESQDKKFEAIVSDEVLDPLKMNHTFPDKQLDVEGQATFYTKRNIRGFKECKPVNNFFKLAGGGYLSTSEDIVKLGNAYLKEDFLDNTIQREVLESQEVNGKLTYYGVGFQASFDHQNRPFFGHIGNAYGGYGIFYVYPKENMVITILTNCSNPNQDKKFNKIIDSVFKSINKSI